MKTRIALTTILGSLLAVGCSGSSSDDAGEIKIALTLPDTMTINSVDWKVLSSTSAVLLMGTINTSDPNLQPSVVAGVPAGVGDVVVMSAVTNGGVMCSGTSPAFNVVAGQTVPVMVNITCGSSTPGSGLGSAVITATVVPGDSCPVVTAYLLTPGAATSPTGQISVSVAAMDSDMGDTVSFHWSAPAGTFADANVASTTYTCTTAGSEALTVDIADNHMPTPCTTHIQFPAVTCN